MPPVAAAADTFELSPIVAGWWRSVEWRLDVQARVRWIEQALELGISSFDHADIYGDYRAESLFGEALRIAPALRNRLQLITKCGIRLRSEQRPYRINYYDSSAAYVRAQVEQSLRNLHTECLDLVLIHRPDYLLDAAALAEVFEELGMAGKVRHWGVSNHNTSQFALLHRHHPGLRTNQLEFSILQMQALDDGTLDQAQQLGLRPMVWSPLGGGRLFDDSEQARRVRAEMTPIAARHGVSLATLAFAWVLRHPSRPHPITGSGRIEGLRDAVAALRVDLDAQDWYAIWIASKGHALP